jgi:hypothetical protein
MSKDTDRYKKKGDINRKQKREKEIKDQNKKNMPKCKYCKKNFRTNKALQMHIFQVHERRGTKTDKVKFE